jgi:hypothetical protein
MEVKQKVTSSSSEVSTADTVANGTEQFRLTAKFCFLSNMLTISTIFHHHPILLEFSMHKNWFHVLPIATARPINTGNCCHECVKISNMFLLWHNTFIFIPMHQYKTACK